MFLLTVLSVQTTFATDPIAASRRPVQGNWADYTGVLGGIPNYTNKSGSTIAAYAGSPSTIQTALNSASANSYVELGAGTFTINNVINFSRSRVECRGQIDSNGYPATTIVFSGGGDRMFHVAAASWDLSGGSGGFTSVTVTSPAPANLRGVTNVLLSSTPSTLVIGQIATFRSSQTFAGANWSDFLGDEWAQWVRITDKTGNSVSFSPPINSDYLTGTINLTWRPTSAIIQRSGIRNIIIDGNGIGHTLGFSGADECWAYNCVIKHPYTSGYIVYPYACYRIELNHCELTESESFGSSTYCINPAQVSQMLVVNCYMHNFPNMMPMFGLNGSAFAYNYLVDFPYSPANWLSQIVFNHGSHNHYNLFEGNWYPANHNDNFGNSTSRNTVYLRNRMIGWDATGPKTSNTKPFFIGTGNVNMSIVGNVLGRVGTATSYQTTSSEFSASVIYATEGTIATLQRVDNYNTVDSGVPASEALAGGESIVESYLYGEKPSWFGGLPWPWCDPGLYDQSNTETNLPAAFRAILGIDPTPISPTRSLPISRL